MLPSGLYWKSHRCNTHGGYVCKKPSQLSGVGINFNKTVNGSEGSLTTPHYPENYYNHLDFSVRIVGPDRTRLVVKFLKIDVEPQLECLYDFVELKSGDQTGDAVRFCGTHDTDMHRFNFVSEGNEAELRFHSDYSISGSGFAIAWHAVDVSACPLQTLTAKEGVLTSPNYPDFILTHLDCSLTVLAPVGKRVWLEFQDYDIARHGKNPLKYFFLRLLSPPRLWKGATMNSWVGTQTLTTLFCKKKLFFFGNYGLKIKLFFYLLRNQQKTKSRGYVKSPDWSVTKLRDAKLGVFWLGLH
jgi:hypothetical protein